MRLHWLIPITVDATFQFTSKNELARAYKALGYQITTTVAYIEDKSKMDGFSSVEYVHTPKGNLLAKLLFHLRMLQSTWQMNVDVVMFGFQAAHLIPFAWIAKRLFGMKTKLIMDIRTVPVDVKPGIKGKIELGRYRLSLYLADWFCDGLTVITPKLRETVKPSLNRLTNKVGIWTSGVRLEHFERQGVTMHKELGIEGKQVLLYHGVLSPNRGLQNALYAFELLKDKFPQLIFLFVGDGDGRSELEQISQEIELDKRVIFTGKVPYQKIAAYVRTANIAILPFPNITWWAVSSPIKLMEYLATGIPVIATNIEAHKAVIEQTSGAILAKNNQAEVLASCISQGLKNGISPADQKVLENTISWNRQAKSLSDFLINL